MNINLKLVLSLLACFALIVIFDIVKPKSIDWSPGFSYTEKKPYGSYVLLKMFEDMFPKDSILINYESLYTLFSDKSAEHYKSFVDVEFYFNPDQLELEKLLDYVFNGGNAFIAANSFGKQFSDTLKVKSHFSVIDSNITFICLGKPEAKNKFYKISNDVNFTFDKTDSISVQPIGYDSKGSINFIKKNFGSGHFYLHSIPYVFTNYNFLKDDNYRYIEKAVAYLPYKAIIWDESNKSAQYRISSSPIRFILKEEALSWAYFITLSAILLFILMKARREQRIIPVIKPYSNESINFVDTIGRLFFQNQNHTDLLLKRRTYLFEFIRTKYRIDTVKLDEDFLILLNAKTGIQKDFLSKLFNTLYNMKTNSQIAPGELWSINKMIENFYNMCKGT